MRFFKCEICGNIIQMVQDTGMPVSCCGEEMTEIMPGTSDGAREKHVPVASVDGDMVLVKIGSEPHPMTDKHFIEWILIETDKGAYCRRLCPEHAPEAKFKLCESEKVKRVYAYCNLHGLWECDCEAK